MQDGEYYVQTSYDGFYVDSDWDGDNFTKDPIHALKRTDPWVEGRGSLQYTCRKIRVFTCKFGDHCEPRLKTFVSQSHRHWNKVRYFFECPRCGKRIKDYATYEVAKEAWEKLQPTTCEKQIAQLI